MHVSNVRNRSTHAILEEAKALIIQSKPIHFDGGNGIIATNGKPKPNVAVLTAKTSVPVIFDAYLRPESVKMFGETRGVLRNWVLKHATRSNGKPIQRRYRLRRVLGDLALNHVVPVATRYQSILVDNMVKLKNSFPLFRKGMPLQRVTSV